MNIIPNWKERNLRCHFCGETRSVKYEIVEDSKKPNIITTETELRKYGNLTGSPVLGDV